MVFSLRTTVFIAEVRNCDISALEDAGLGLIKRRFLEKRNALLGKSP
jgi:hypothetical protein